MRTKMMKRASLGVLFSALGLLGASILSAPAFAENFKEKLVQRPAMLSSKVTQSLLLDVAVHGSTVVAVGERGHVIVSHDDGNTWVQSATPVSIMLTAVALPNDKDIWVVGHEGLIMHSPDDGKTWELQYGNPYVEPAADDMEAMDNMDQRAGQPLLDVWFKDASKGFAIGAYGSFLHTSDGGKTWEDWSDRMPNEDQWHLNSITSRDGNRFYVVGEKGVIFRSDDAGESWVSVASPYEGSLFGAIAGPGLNEVTVFGLQGNLFRSTDKGDSWHQIKSPTENTLMSGVFLNGRNVVLVGNSGTILYSRDDGNTFELQQMKDRLSIVGIQANAEGKLVMVGQGGVRLASPALK